MGNSKILSRTGHILTAIGIFAATGLAAQTQRFTGEEWKDPNIYSLGTAPLRTEFVSFDTRDQSDKGTPENSPFYMPLDFDLNGSNSATVRVEIPYMWLDREVFLHTGLDTDAYYVKVNDRTIGYVRDNATPAEFNISRWIADGENTITIEYADGDVKKMGYEGQAADRDVYIYSQPKIRIEDYNIKASIDSSRTHCILRVEIALANSFNSNESFRVGYDIYRPDGELIHYDLRDVTLRGNSRDTVVFEQPIYNKVMDNLWSGESPKLYDLTLNVSYDKRWIEYIPVKVGFGETVFADGAMTRNGKPVELKVASYAKANKEFTPGHLKALKKAGYNAVSTAVPQPRWFYDMCAEAGMYVIDGANIYSADDASFSDNREVGGNNRNDPAWLGTFLGRAQAMHARAKNYPAIIAWSIGGETGNGYNMYKVYQLMKAHDRVRPVVFNYAAGEWNSDLQIAADDVEAILKESEQKAPAPVKKSATRR